eukprot:superscaffoldBa00004817_g19493
MLESEPSRECLCHSTGCSQIPALPSCQRCAEHAQRQPPQTAILLMVDDGEEEEEDVMLKSLLLRHHLDVGFNPCSPDSALPAQLWDPEDKRQPIQEPLIVAREAPQSPPASAFNGLPCRGPCEPQSLFFLPILPQCVSLRPPCSPPSSSTC